MTVQDLTARRNALANELERLRVAVTIAENKAAELVGAMKQKEGALALCNELLAAEQAAGQPLTPPGERP